MKKQLKILLLVILLLPNLVFASSTVDNSSMPLGVALIVEAFISIHMSVFVLMPLAKLISKANYKKTFWKMFAIRVFILLYFDLYITTFVALFDFIAVFVGAITVGFITALVNKKNINSPALKNNEVITAKPGATTDDKVSANEKEATAPKKEAVLAKDYDPLYSMNEEQMVEVFINRELKKAGIENNSTLIPGPILKKKIIFHIFLVLLIFTYLCLIFFHFPIYTYLIGLILLIIFYKKTKSYNLNKYIKKQLMARPSEKVSNIVMSIKATFVNDNKKVFYIITLIIAVVLPLIIFMNPKIMYEKVDQGYGVRFYTFGLTNFTSAKIPKTYKGEKVVTLRGNTFSNMFLLKEVKLPDSITEIRGQAFKNDFKLAEVNIPPKLKYLGGGAFYNCKSLKTIELPDTLIYMGGETFYGASALEYVKLSKKLTEIRGNTFENCRSLKAIAIPDQVTRIGGHAFYGDSALAEVTFTEDSELSEIGSSAFRLCSSLKTIILPDGVEINERAFKESPTQIQYFSQLNDPSSIIHTLNSYSDIYQDQNIHFINEQLLISLFTIYDDGLESWGTLSISSQTDNVIFEFNTSSNKIITFESYVINISRGVVFNEQNEPYISIQITDD